MFTMKSLRHAAVVALALPVTAFAGDYGTLYLAGSSNGLGIGYAASVSEDFALRGQYNAFKRSFTGNVGDFGSNANLTLDFNLSSLQLLGDWYPGAGGFRLTGGVVKNDNKITLDGSGQVNGKDAFVNGEIKLSNNPSPYLGLGYSTRPKEAKGFGFVFDLGFMKQDPKISLSATGNGTTITAQDIDAQVFKMQDDMDKLKLMPVLGVGLSYAF